MWRRLSWLSIALVGGCLDRDTLVDDTFTPDQWAKLQAEFTLPPQLAVDPGNVPMSELGQRMFFDPALSASHAMACTTCHDPASWFVDTRNPNNLSMGVNGPTPHNSIGLVNIGLKDKLAPHNDDEGTAHQVFTFSGGYKLTPTGPAHAATTVGSVMDLAIVKPMASSHLAVHRVIYGSDWYRAQYSELFGVEVPPCLAMDFSCAGTEEVFTNLEYAMAAYLDRLVSVNAPFDRWLRGDAKSGMSEAAQRGFAVFVGRGMCAECHSGPLFSDFKFHDTGVPQSGPSDAGRYAITGRDEDRSKFLTQPLRQSAQTGAYMHDGYYASLSDVIEFYRKGGAGGGAGTVDPRMAPSEMTDDDASDLEQFLGSLTGDKLTDTAPDLTKNTCVQPKPPPAPQYVVCAGECVLAGSPCVP